MVNLKLLKFDDFNDVFDSLREALGFIKSKGYVSKRFTKEELIALVHTDVLQERKEQDELLAEEENEKKVYHGTRIPVIKNESSRARVGYVNKLNQHDFNEYEPRFLMIYTGDFVDDPGAVHTSDDKKTALKLIKKKKLVAKFITSQREYDDHKAKFQRLLPLLYDKIKWHEYIITASDIEGVDYEYRINGRIKDYTQFIVSTCSHESPQPFDVKLNCVIACILEQNAEFFGTTKRNTLIKCNNKKDIKFNDIEQLAMRFKLYIKIFDCEADVWKVFNFRDTTVNNKRNKINKNIHLLVHNGHARSLNKQYSVSDSHNHTESSLRVEYVKPFINPVGEDKPEYYELDATITPEMVIHDGPLSFEYNQINKSYVIFVVGDLRPYLERLCEDDVLPVIIGTRTTGLMALKIPIGKHTIQLRSESIRHQLLDATTYSNNYTLGSTTMRLFQQFIDVGILKVCDSVIAKVFKHMCSPLMYMEQVDLTGWVYVFDLKKAYRNRAKDLGSFERQPVLSLNTDVTEDGVYEVIGLGNNRIEWMTLQMYKYEKKKNKNISHRYSIRYNARTNILDDFATYIYEDDSPFADCDDKTRKNTFNVLIGKLNPNVDNISGHSIFGNLVDMNRFLLKNDKTVFRIDEVKGKYIVEYAPDTDDDFQISNNASYLSAQIINRCKLDVLRMSGKLHNQGCTIVGSMTDSVICVSPHKLEDIPGFVTEVAVNGRIVSKGVGQYTIFDTSDNVVRERHLGHKEEIDIDILKTAHTVQHKAGKGVEIPDNTQTLKVITGKAGYGKSHCIKQSYFDKKCVRVAYTGIAAAEIDGQTINSLFKLGHDGDNKLETSLVLLSKQSKLLLSKASTLVIDEYYTIPASIIKKMNILLKFVRQSSYPFGGLDVICVGDHRQTAAIGKSFADSSLFKLFNAKEVLKRHPKMRLTEKYDKWCCRFRNATLDMAKAKELCLALPREKPIPYSKGVYSVYYTNAEKDACNLKMLDEFKGDPLGTGFKKGCPIRMKKNACGFYNGSLVELVDIHDKEITVRHDNEEHTLPLDNVEFELAFALTIHSAQCKTFKGINIYFDWKMYKNDSDSALRLLYTALTRVRDFKNVYFNNTSKKKHSV